jgi:hypothetical protein
VLDSNICPGNQRPTGDSGHHHRGPLGTLHEGPPDRSPVAIPRGTADGASFFGGPEASGSRQRWGGSHSTVVTNVSESAKFRNKIAAGRRHSPL